MARQIAKSTGKQKRKRPQNSDARRAAARKRAFENAGAKLFTTAGFKRFEPLAGDVFNFSGVDFEFDDCYVYEQVVILVEYTVTSDEEKISTHYLSKKARYDRISANVRQFVRFILARHTALASALPSAYRETDLQVRIVYMCNGRMKDTIRPEANLIRVMEPEILEYFRAVTKTLQRSSKYELLSFLGYSEAKDSSGVRRFDGYLLPEGYTKFDDGFKVVSFYADPESLLKCSYVLRRDGWRLEDSLYQRMISRAKVESIRQYLLDKKRVFVNNIVVTLPSETRLFGVDNHTVDAVELVEKTHVCIQIPDQINRIGIIDGQHRVFSYYEGGAGEDIVERLRKQQNLLVTGIIFPNSYTEQMRMRFEAQLFLEINTNQATAKSELRQEIGVILTPFDTISMARVVLNRMNVGPGPLAGIFARSALEKGKLKTSTVVRYGLKYLIDPGAQESFFSVWDNPNKQGLSDQNELVRDEYISFCVNSLSTFIGAVKSNVTRERWTQAKKGTDGVLNTTYVIGFILCLRRIVRDRRLMSFADYKVRMEKINDFPFKNFASARYDQMGEEMYERYFKE